MMRRARIVIGIIILAVSISFLIWGFAPARRVIRIHPIAPIELHLSIPSPLQSQPVPVS